MLRPNVGTVNNNKNKIDTTNINTNNNITNTDARH